MARKFSGAQLSFLKKSNNTLLIEDGDVVKRAIQYKIFIDNIDFSIYKQEYIVCMDKTAVYLAQIADTTINAKR
jgi:hypothetical protein